MFNPNETSIACLSCLETTDEVLCRVRSDSACCRCESPPTTARYSILPESNVPQGSYGLALVRAAFFASVDSREATLRIDDDLPGGY